jgi:hypothetical protein
MNWSFLADHYPKKIARVDCSEDENMIFCAKQNLTSFPTMVRCPLASHRKDQLTRIAGASCYITRVYIASTKALRWWPRWCR